MSENVPAECETHFLSQFLVSGNLVSVYLKHGIKLMGSLVAVSEGVIFLGEPIPQMIYKSSISTIIEVF